MEVVVATSEQLVAGGGWLAERVASIAPSTTRLVPQCLDRGYRPLGPVLLVSKGDERAMFDSFGVDVTERVDMSTLLEPDDRPADDVAPSAHSFLVEPAWYDQLDVGIRFPVRVLHARGVQTGQSCQGGAGHSYDRPTVDLWGGGRFDGLVALAALEEYGLRVRDLSFIWHIEHGLPVEQHWRLTLWQSWEDRADEIPMFAWSHEATAAPRPQS